MKLLMLVSLAAIAVPTWAQTPTQPQILVSATGMVRTPPDMATVRFTVRGEGTTSDEAAAKLRDNASAIGTGVAGLLQKAAEVHSSNFAIAQIRSKECDASNYGQERLSTGACAIIGYVATMPMTIDTPHVADAGTLTALVGRLGGLGASTGNFRLSNDGLARRRAMQAALANAQAQASLIAESSGAKLGPLLRVQDADYRKASMEFPTGPEADGAPGAPPPPPPPPPPPVRIGLAPEPIQTTVQIMVAYAIDR